MALTRTVAQGGSAGGHLAAFTALCGTVPAAETFVKVLYWYTWQGIAAQCAWRAVAGIVRKGALETGAAGGGRGRAK